MLVTNHIESIAANLSTKFKVDQLVCTKIIKDSISEARARRDAGLVLSRVDFQSIVSQKLKSYFA